MTLKCLGPNDSEVPWADDSEMPWAGCLKIQEIQSQNSDCLENTVSKIRPRTAELSQTIRKALGRRNTVLLKI